MITRVMEKMIRYFGHDVRRINHAMKVYDFALLISSRENPDIRTRGIIGYTALLHDIGIHEAERKYQSTAGNYQQIEGPPIARQILTELEVAEEITERVCFITGNHHTYNKIDGIDFQIVVEADFLVNFFEDGMSREAIASVNERVFRTDSGKELLRIMYLD
jgi:HD superfamily phosphodiesterase